MKKGLFKRITALGLSALLAFSLTACGDSTEKDDNSSNISDPGQTSVSVSINTQAPDAGQTGVSVSLNTQTPDTSNSDEEPVSISADIDDYGGIWLALDEDLVYYFADVDHSWALTEFVSGELMINGYYTGNGSAIELVTEEGTQYTTITAKEWTTGEYYLIDQNGINYFKRNDMPKDPTVVSYPLLENAVYRNNDEGLCVELNDNTFVMYYEGTDAIIDAGTYEPYDFVGHYTATSDHDPNVTYTFLDYTMGTILIDETLLLEIYKYLE